MKPEGSLLHSQVPATCPYPEPARSSSYPHILKIHLITILPTTSGCPKWSPSLRFPPQNPVHASPLLHTRYMPRPSHSSLFYHPNILNVLKREILSTDRNPILVTDLKLRFSEVWRRVFWYIHIKCSKDPLLPSTRWWFHLLPTTVWISKPPRQRCWYWLPPDDWLHCVPPCMTVMCQWTETSASHRCTMNSLASTGYQTPVLLAACVRDKTWFSPAYTNIDVRFLRMTQTWSKHVGVVVH